jgi:hypothetical protein
VLKLKSGLHSIRDNLLRESIDQSLVGCAIENITVDSNLISAQAPAAFSRRKDAHLQLPQKASWKGRWHKVPQITSSNVTIADGTASNYSIPTALATSPPLSNTMTEFTIWLIPYISTLRSNAYKTALDSLNNLCCRLLANNTNLNAPRVARNSSEDFDATISEFALDGGDVISEY